MKTDYDKRISELLAKMTQEEKISQLSEGWGVPGVERLNIPPLYKSECVHGYSYGTGATIFPHAIALGSCWDVEMVRKVGEVIGRESIAANAFQAWTPVLDVARDMRWGRVEESYGEDTHLVTKIGGAWIQGYQGCGLTATPKHFAAHGAPAGGRDSHYVGYSDRVLREVHYPPFREAVKKHKVKSVMSAYHFLDGIGCTASHQLLTKLLREEWGFDGFVVTDVGAPDNIIEKQYNAANNKQAAALMIKAGVDLCATKTVYEQGLLPALEEGLITQQEIDQRVANVLRVKMELGLFEREENPPLIWSDVDQWDIPEHRRVARQAAQKSIVLLKNDNKLLPMSKQIKSIALIGPAIKQQELGDYSCEPVEDQLVTIYDGIKGKLATDVQINYAKGCDFIGSDTSGFCQAKEAALKSDIVVIAVGDLSNMTTGENRDRACLELTGVQSQLIETVASAGKPIVLVLACGKPATIEWAAENVPSILMSWYSGEEGGNAIADVIFGDYNPAGKLPVTWPKSSIQLPLFYNYHLSGRGYDYMDMPFAPAYRFGYGLSYTSFEYGNMDVKQQDGRLEVWVDVTNTGSCGGEEVVQLYVTQMYPKVSTPITELKGFKRLFIDQGETKRVGFTVEPYDISVLDLDMKRVVHGGQYKILVGGVSPTCPHTSFLKQNLGYDSAAEGVSQLVEIASDLRADFEFGYENGQIWVKNIGQITDVIGVNIYAHGQLLDNMRFEAEPGERIGRTYSVGDKDITDITLVGYGKIAKFKVGTYE